MRSSMQSELAGRIDAFVQDQLRKDHVPGVSLAVVQDRKLALAKGYGLANVECSVPATEDTVYQIASITKTFTATAIMMLIESGEFGLEDKIADLLPDLPAAWGGVSVRHLLNHTSGIKSYTNLPDFNQRMRENFAPRELIDLVANEPMEFAPGENWNYNNTGYVLLGMLIEKTTGATYGEFLAERIFQPLEMTQTRVNDLRAVIPNRAQGYSWDDETMRNGEYVSPSQPFSAGVLVSTVLDLAKWDAALNDERLLKSSALERMWTATLLRNGETANYGLGWQAEDANGHRVIAHSGGIPGFASRLSRFPDDQLTVIVLLNGESIDASAFARDIAGFFSPELARIADSPGEAGASE